MGVVALPTQLGSRYTWGAEYKTWLTENVFTETGYMKAGGTNSPIATILPIVNLAAGSDLTARPIFASFYASTLTKIGILTMGAPAGIDDANTVVLTIKNNSGTTIVTKTYDTSNQPPSTTFADLGALSVTAFASNEFLTITIVQGTTANLPAFAIVLE